MKRIALLLISLILTGCSAQPTSMIFSPPKVYSMDNIYQGQSYNIVVNDNRSQKHLLKVIDADGKKSHHPAKNAIHSKLHENLSTGFEVQGLTINEHAPASISLSILQLETIVAQQNLQYDASLSVEFKITIKRGSKTFNKTFTGHTNREGVLQFDIARLEQDLNQLVNTVLGDIFNDDYIRQSIQA